jgi:predicted O-methyltransferase YrrM
MQFTLDSKYKITHAWYEQLLKGYQVVSQEPKAEKLRFKPQEQRTIVEIGIYEGASSVWWSDNLLEHPESRLYCIDPFTGNEEYQQTPENFPTLDQIEVIARGNIGKSKNAGKISIIKGCSWDVFPMVSRELKGQIDILYIDGEHTANAVCRDAALYYPLLKSGGALIFDDYGHEDVKRGIDGALTAFGNIENAFYTGWQLWCIKK